MLYLQLPAESGQVTGARVPVAAATAARLERALLAADLPTRERELVAAFERDPLAASWLVAAARLHDAPTPTQLDVAIAWLVPRLEQEIAAAIESSDDQNALEKALPTEIETRLPALAARLADYRRQLDKAAAQLERDKLEALKELAYGASHEINNPLANIAARAQSLREDEADPERQRKLIAIHRQAMRAHEMIADLMLFARPPKLNPTICELMQLVRQVVDEFDTQAEEQGTRLTYEAVRAPLALSVDGTQIAVAVRALIRNALEAVGQVGNVCVQVRPATFAGRPGAEITVRDDGPGISDAVRQHLFDPFFSGREAGRGLGFGLSKCWRVIREHGGEIVVQSPAEGGATFSLLVPNWVAPTPENATANCNQC